MSLQNSPGVVHSLWLIQRVPLPTEPQYFEVEETSNKHPAVQPAHSVSLVQGLAHVPLLSSTVPAGQAAHVRSTQLPLQHWWFFLHFLLRGLHSSSAAATPPSDPSVPPTRAAPISLSALPRESVPLASPLVSSSKVWLVDSWLTCLPPFPEGRDSSAPLSRTTPPL